MTGKQLINLISLMSYGRILPVNEERLLNLQYLNLANMDLWSTMINAKEQYNLTHLIHNDNEEENEAAGYSVKVEGGKIIYTLKAFLCLKIKGLFNKNRERIEYCKFNSILSPSDLEYSVIKTDYIFKDITNNKFIYMVYIPVAPYIEDNEDEIIHYPLVFQSALLEGALYYSYLSTFGFMDKIQIQLQVWENLKKNIITFNAT